VGVETDLSVSYDVPPDEVHRVLRGVLRDLPGAVTEPAPQVLTRELADNGIVYTCRAWTTTAWSDLRFRSELLTRAYAALGRARMEIPFPQRTVHVAPRRRPADPRPRLRAALEACDLFRGLPESSLELLAAASRLLRFAPGEAVIREGEGSTAMYAIASGSVEVRQRRGNGDAVVGVLDTGHAFGEVAFLRGSRRLATVAATAPLEVVEIGEEALRLVLQQAPELAEELAQRVAAHERSTEEVAAIDIGAPREGRTAVADLLGAIWRRFGGRG
jgi:CRP-like cAMP-binding protein